MALCGVATIGRCIRKDEKAKGSAKRKTSQKCSERDWAGRADSSVAPERKERKEATKKGPRPRYRDKRRD